MSTSPREHRSAAALRRELAARGLARADRCVCEVGYGRTPAVLYAEETAGVHGNFLRASYRRIVANPAWAQRLSKAYTGGDKLPRRGDRWRGELECTTSSDALLMNVFCYPGVLRRRGVCALLGVEAGLQPAFGVRAALPMHRGEIDRTELDMCLGTSSCGSTLVEAKLTEGGFGKAAPERVLRYLGIEEVFDVAALPRVGAAIAGYQVVRGVLAALGRDGRYLVLLDDRRADLKEICLRVLMAARTEAVRQKLQLCTWQELAGTLTGPVQAFLAEKYGIEARPGRP